MKNLPPIFGDSSIIDVYIGLGEVLFVGEAVSTTEDSEKGNGADLLTGNKLVLQELLERDSQGPVMKD